MTISAARTKLIALKTAILADGIIDFDETFVLLDFIDPYVKASNTRFVEFRKNLIKAREDGKITPEESNALVCEIDSIISFLTTEALIEKVVFGGLGLAFLGYIIFSIIMIFV